MNQNKNKGFSLLEAIVAMAIVAGFGMAIFAWINTNLTSLHRIEVKSSKDQIIRSVAEFMQNIDVMSKPQGEAMMGGYKIEWEGTLIEPQKNGVNRSGATGDFRLGLYDTNVSISLDTVEVAQFSIRLVGYLKVRDSFDRL